MKPKSQKQFFRIMYLKVELLLISFAYRPPDDANKQVFFNKLTALLRKAVHSYKII